MANSRRRVDSYRDRIITTYEYDGSAVRKLEELPEQHEEQQRRSKTNRSKAVVRRYSVSRGYVLFLAFVCIAVSALCIMYLRQKATITTQYETIAELESEYSQLRSNNDAKYNQVMDSVSIEDIKNAAENRLGMSYAGAGQIVYYDLTDGSYVRQYKDVPTE
ncbi:MAG TPA: hypothetical protein IAB17_01365 [Candidatus Alectryocaccobium stercorigallinarum]|nr:hypothetical protein [Candidatus Alectryocaccobium stercorigallinarum]